jgi:hypothetical protein
MSRVTDQHDYAKRYLAGGVSSSTRVNQAIGHAMLFDRAQGCRVWDLDGKEYIDFCCSHGAALLGMATCACPSGGFPAHRCVWASGEGDTGVASSHRVHSWTR